MWNYIKVCLVLGFIWLVFPSKLSFTGIIALLLTAVLIHIVGTGIVFLITLLFGISMLSSALSEKIADMSVIFLTLFCAFGANMLVLKIVNAIYDGVTIQGGLLFYFLTGLALAFLSRKKLKNRNR